MCDLTFSVGDRVIIDRLPGSSGRKVNGTRGVVTEVGVHCSDGGSEGLIKVITAGCCAYRCEPENLVRREGPSPSKALLTTLCAGEFDFHYRIALVKCWQVVILFIGLGGIAGWCLALALSKVAAWSAQESAMGTFGWLFFACFAINALDGQVNGLTPQTKRWVTDGTDHMLLASPGGMLAPVAGFAVVVTLFGHNPVGTWVLLIASSMYHCFNACVDFDAFCDMTLERWIKEGNGTPRVTRMSPHERENVEHAIWWDATSPYARLGLGIGLSLYAVLPLAWVAMPAFTGAAFSHLSRMVIGLPAIILGMALAVGCYVSVTTISWEWATVA